MKLLEVNIAGKIEKDPKFAKQLTIAWRHDDSIENKVHTKLGPHPTEATIIKTWSDVLDASLSNTEWGDISDDSKVDDWVLRAYINGVVNYHEIYAKVPDVLGAWRALGKRGMLEPKDQDLNKFKNIAQVQAVINDENYNQKLEDIKNEEMIEKHKRDAKEVVLIDDDRFFVTVMLSYGACYLFNHGGGYHAVFCTGSSSGLSNFKDYSEEAPIVGITDKKNKLKKDGKWQFYISNHGSVQLMNGEQDHGNNTNMDKDFAKLFPGLMKRIADELVHHAAELKEKSKKLKPPGYNAAREAEKIKKTFPHSMKE
jgi:hypothetical protein